MKYISAFKNKSLIAKIMFHLLKLNIVSAKGHNDGDLTRHL
jgi:hypothetical protein